MKLIIILFLISLFNQDSYLIKQGDIEVPLGDLDAYVYSLQEDQRNSFSQRKQQIEQNIFTLLNINIIYQHVLATGMNDLDVFKTVMSNFKTPDFDENDEFIKALNVDEKEISEAIRMYHIKTEFYKTFLTHVKESITDEVVESLALEYYMVNKKEFLIPEKRDISVIVLDSELSEEDAESILKTAQLSDKVKFEILAKDHSIDPNVKNDSGHWGEYKELALRYQFSRLIFNSPIGVIPAILEDKGKRYIVKINDILPSEQSSFDDIKSSIFTQLKEQAVKRKFQSIINEKGQNKIEVNPELVAHVFERYKVLATE